MAKELLGDSRSLYGRGNSNWGRAAAAASVIGFEFLHAKQLSTLFLESRGERRRRRRRRPML